MTPFLRKTLFVASSLLLIAVNLVLIWAAIINPDLSDPTKLAMIGILLLVDAIFVALMGTFPI